MEVLYIKILCSKLYFEILFLSIFLLSALPFLTKCEYASKCTYKKSYGWNPSKCIYENSKYLKAVVDNSNIVCDEVIYAMDIVPTNMATNFDDKKVGY